MVAVVLILGGLGGAAFHPPAAVLVHQHSGEQRGLAMSFHITSGTLGQSIAPLAFAPFVQHYGLSATPLLMVPALIVLGGVLAPPPAADRTAAGIARQRRVCGASSVRAAPGAAVLHRRAADVDRDEFLDVRAGDADAARHDAGAGRHGRVGVSVRDGARRLLRGPGRRSIRPAPRDHPVAHLRRAVSRRRAAAVRLAVRRHRWRSADSCCSPRCR